MPGRKSVRVHARRARVDAVVATPRRPRRRARPQRESSTTPKEDERLRRDVCRRLVERGIDARDVDVSVHEGQVTLTGTVLDMRQKKLVDEACAACPGVTDVQNGLRLRTKRAEE